MSTVKKIEFWLESFKGAFSTDAELFLNAEDFHTGPAVNDEPDRGDYYALSTCRLPIRWKSEVRPGQAFLMMGGRLHECR